MIKFLTAAQHQNPLDKEGVVKNISSKTPYRRKGSLGFRTELAIAPKQVPTLDIIAAREPTASHLDDKKVQQLRLEVGSILSSSKPPKDNLTGDNTRQSGAYAETRKLLSSQLTKGTLLVVMNHSDYTEKI